MNKVIKNWKNEIHEGECRNVLKNMPSECVDCVVTGPPYWGLRDYDEREQIGMESELDEYISEVVSVFDEVQRVLKDDGVCFVNIGEQFQSTAPETKNTESNLNQKTAESQGCHYRFDSGLPAKCRMQIPERFSIKMVDSGWILRDKVVWEKSNPLPEPSAKDRFWNAWEPVFMFTKNSQYNFNEDWSDEENVWKIATASANVNHPAPFHIELPQRLIQAGCPEEGVVLDPFIGSGTTAVAAEQLGREWIGIDLNSDYADISEERIRQETGILQENPLSY